MTIKQPAFNITVI